jgi:N-methylhydantoinase B
MPGMQLDPAKYEVFFSKLDQALNEGQSLVRLLSASVIVREAGESLEAFYLPNGDCVDIASGILMHFMNITRVIRYMKEQQYDTEDIGIYEDDQFINNDAYIGGMHVPDIGMIAPFFYKGELLGYLAAVSHTTEVGAIEPGGQAPSATEAWHEGLHLPAIKIVDRGRIRRDVWNLLLRSTRDPRTMELDQKAKFAGNERTRQRLAELVDEFGADFFKAATKELVNDGERFFRERVKQLRPGVYTARVFPDTLGGIMPPKLSVIQVDLEVREDGSIALNIPVVSPQQPCYNNAYLPAVEATLFYCLLTQLVYDCRWNSGMANAVEISVPGKSRLNADSSQAVGYATVGIGFNLAGAITEALSRAFYVSGMEDNVQAAPTWGSSGLMLSGLDRFGRFSTQIGYSRMWSGGGTLSGDGVVNYHYYNPWQYVNDVETDEALTTSLCLSLLFIPDSGGFGKFRGGSVTAPMVMIHGTNFATPSALGSGTKLAGNQGMFGGYPGHVCHVTILKDTNLYELIRDGKPLPQDWSSFLKIDKIVKGNSTKFGASVPKQSMKEGDLLISMNSAGAGLGDPIERDPLAIVEDLKVGKATLEVAQRVYAVSVDPETLQIDWEETKRKREEKRKERLHQGIPGGEYVRLLVEKRRKRELPQPALEFLDELMAFSSPFREQVKIEERLAGQELKPLKEAKVKNVLLKLTPYVDIVEDENEDKVAVCSKCGFAYCDAKDDYKLYCLILDRDPADILPPPLAPDKDWAVYREFYCPACGTQVEVDQVPPGMTIIPNASIKGASY